jgi:hypothetical protein
MYIYKIKLYHELKQPYYKFQKQNVKCTKKTQYDNEKRTPVILLTLRECRRTSLRQSHGEVFKRLACKTMKFQHILKLIYKNSRITVTYDI